MRVSEAVLDVAIAIYISQKSKDAEPWNEIDEWSRRSYIRAARAAIKAMRPS